MEVLLRAGPEQSVEGLTVPSVACRASSGLHELHKATGQAVAVAVWAKLSVNVRISCLVSANPRDLLMVVLQEGAVQQFYSIKHKPYRNLLRQTPPELS